MAILASTWAAHDASVRDALDALGAVERKACAATAADAGCPTGWTPATGCTAQEFGEASDDICEARGSEVVRVERTLGGGSGKAVCADGTEQALVCCERRRAQPKP